MKRESRRGQSGECQCAVHPVPDGYYLLTKSQTSPFWVKVAVMRIRSDDVVRMRPRLASSQFRAISRQPFGCGLSPSLYSPRTRLASTGKGGDPRAGQVTIICTSAEPDSVSPFARRGHGLLVCPIATWLACSNQPLTPLSPLRRARTDNKSFRMIENRTSHAIRA